jgi:hypothetical protein
VAASTFTSDNIGNADPITVERQCNEVIVQENGKANTTSYRIYDPDLNASPVTRAVGEPYVFRRTAPWIGGTTVGFIETIDAASATFSREEKLNPY